ncbi:MAG: hypothetical protein J5792_00830 [Bacteroidales bacterium]|nr:hypothetical protein [Bacteroidales bacterium]
MKRIIFFPIAAMLVGLLSNSCKKEDPRGRYVGTYRCSYKETMWSFTYGSYVLKDLSDTIINITPSSRYEDGVDILFFSFTIDVDGNILKGYGNSPGGFNTYKFRVKGDSLYFDARWGGLGGATFYNIKGVRISWFPYQTGNGN